MPPEVPFRDALKRPLVFDGAMGTELYRRGYFFTRSFDEANLARPRIGDCILPRVARHQAVACGATRPGGAAGTS
jgi:hypothetical protein